MRPNTMVYKYPGPHKLHGDGFDYLIVDDDELPAILAEGWSLTTTEAKEKTSQVAEKTAEKTADESPVNRAELEQKAGELGIKFDGRTTDRKLSELIAAKLG